MDNVQDLELKKVKHTEMENETVVTGDGKEKNWGGECQRLPHCGKVALTSHRTAVNIVFAKTDCRSSWQSYRKGSYLK